ncbi:hypothetical protein J2TS6_42700 [Paenibacillus albilobatus]|uniref:Late control protein n=1 Tax=Paenibacillus albilobatus TaxID=2716884 RepID=A0A920CDR6_9BACL|nr:late control protein [Paenibacillus albilobatus]GIO33129.1 hypothetical protein J2TS6_42700 [Paenibacillus albilobatus]
MAKVVVDGRRAHLALKYNGVAVKNEWLQDYLIDFTYTDAAPGEQDSIAINLDDRDRKWMGPWVPKFGDKISAEITLINWDKPGEKKKLPCGSFEVDTLDLDGPPDKVSIQALAIPTGGAGALQEARTKAWEKVKLKTIAAEIAKRAKLKLVYSSASNPSYDRLDQNEQPDLDFLNQTAKAEGIAVKISGGCLAMFDEEEYEKKPAVIDIVRGKSNILSYKFSDSTTNVIYGSCVVTYRPPVSKAKKKEAKDKKKKDGKDKTPKAAAAKKKKAGTPKSITASYTMPGGSKLPVLRINEKVDSIAEGQRLAKNRLREKNKEAGRASFTLEGDIRLASSVTANVKGFGRFDGKYIVESATHKIGGGPYTTDIEIRKVLGW